ncbi:hypothetical protein BDV06DRAFT_200237 [Aspergillus oleicola]
MPLSIDTSIAFVTLLLTGTSALLEIWTYIANTYKRNFVQVTPSTAALTDQEVLLEAGLNTNTHQAPTDIYQPSELRLTLRTRSV